MRRFFYGLIPINGFGPGDIRIDGFLHMTDLSAEPAEQTFAGEIVFLLRHPLLLILIRIMILISPIAVDLEMRVETK